MRARISLLLLINLCVAVSLQSLVTEYTACKFNFIDFFIQRILYSAYIFFIISVSSWKLSRQRNLSTDSSNAINNVINSIPVLRQDYFELQGHTDEDCFYYPEPVVGEPVVFPGQCDNNIRAVPDFDLTQVSSIFGYFYSPLTTLTICVAISLRKLNRSAVRRSLIIRPVL